MKIASLVLFTCLFVACAKTDSGNIANQEEIYTTYKANYTEAKNSSLIEISANFNLAGPTGTYIELSGGSMVMVDDTPMTKEINEINQVTYKFVLHNPTLQDLGRIYHVKYVNNNRVMFDNQVTFTMPIELSMPDGRVESSLKNPLEIRWDSRERLEHESIFASISNLDERTSISAETRQSEATGNQGVFIFNPESLQEVKAGKILVSACREHEVENPKIPFSGGSLTISSCSQKFEHKLIAGP